MYNELWRNYQDMLIVMRFSSFYDMLMHMYHPYLLIFSYLLLGSIRAEVLTGPIIKAVKRLPQVTSRAGYVDRTNTAACRSCEEIPLLPLEQYAKNLFVGAAKCQKKGKQLSCTGVMKGMDYPRPITIYIPLNYSFPARPTLQLFLHGNRLKGKTWEEDVSERFKLENALDKNGRDDQILVIPQSEGKNTDHTAYFGSVYPKKGRSPSKFNEFITQLSSSFETTGICSSCATDGFLDIAISGHSGAWRSVFSILSHEADRPVGRIGRVNFIDAIFTVHANRYKQVARYMKKNPKAHVSVISVVTKRQTKKMEKYLGRKPKIKNVTQKSTQRFPQKSCYKAHLCFHYVKSDKSLGHWSIVPPAFTETLNLQ